MLRGGRYLAVLVLCLRVVSAEGKKCRKISSVSNTAWESWSSSSTNSTYGTGSSQTYTSTSSQISATYTVTYGTTFSTTTSSETGVSVSQTSSDVSSNSITSTSDSTTDLTSTSTSTLTTTVASDSSTTSESITPEPTVSGTATSGSTTTSDSPTSESTTSDIVTTTTTTTTTTTSTTTTPFTAPTFFLQAANVELRDVTDVTTFQRNALHFAQNVYIPGHSTPYDFLYFSELTPATATLYTIDSDGQLINTENGKIANAYASDYSAYIYFDFPEYIGGGYEPLACQVSEAAVLSCTLSTMYQFSICFTDETDLGLFFLTESPQGQGDVCRGVQVVAIAPPIIPDPDPTSTLDPLPTKR